MLPRSFGLLPTGESVTAYTLANTAGASVQILTYGGIVTSLRVPDRHGRFADVVLGFDHLAPYVAGHPYFGAITGRIAGRVSKGRINVAGRAYDLLLNSGPNHLHGGATGLDKRVWATRCRNFLWDTAGFMPSTRPAHRYRPTPPSPRGVNSNGARCGPTPQALNRLQAGPYIDESDS